MLRLFFIFIIAGSLTLGASDIDLNESKGTDQSVIASLSPAKAQIDVWNNAKIEISFNVPIDASSVQKNNIKLVHLSSNSNDHIDGAISYDKYDNKVVFVPSDLLPVGAYEVEIKSLKADKAYKSTQIKEIKYRFYVPEVINGHQLPPEPDPVVNNSTLLGIDVNDNGVRDDLEIKFARTYQGYPHASKEFAIAMQYARAAQIIVQEPDQAWEKGTYRLMHDAVDCTWYYLKKYYTDTTSVIEHNIFTKEFEYGLFNTEDRLKAYFKYNAALSGHVFTRRKKTIDFCETNIDLLREE